MNWMKKIVESAGNVADKKAEAGIFSEDEEKQRAAEKAEKDHQRLLKSWRKQSK